MDYLGEAICFSLDSLIFGLFFREYLRSKQALQSVREVPEFHNGKDITQFLDDNGGSYPYIAVRGFVKALAPAIKSINYPQVLSVIQKRSVKEHVISRSSSGFWSESQRTINEVYNTVPFAVMSRLGNLEIEVVDGLSAKMLDLEVISDKFDPTNSGFIEHMWGFFTGIRKRGLQTIEEVLREGTLVTAIGEIQSDINGVKIQPPSDGTPFFLTTLPLSSLIRRMDEKVKYYWWISMGFGVIGIFLFGILAKKYWKKRMDSIEKEEKRKRLELTRKERRRSVRNTETLSDDKICVVCRVNPKEIILLPCGHVSLCEDCGEKINDVCPICKTPISSQNPAYIC